MSPWLGTLTAPSEDLSLGPSTHIRWFTNAYNAKESDKPQCFTPKLKCLFLFLLKQGLNL